MTNKIARGRFIYPARRVSNKIETRDLGRGVIADKWKNSVRIHQRGEVVVLDKEQMASLMRFYCVGDEGKAGA